MISRYIATPPIYVDSTIPPDRTFQRVNSRTEIHQQDRFAFQFLRNFENSMNTLVDPVPFAGTGHDKDWWPCQGPYRTNVLRQNAVSADKAGYLPSGVSELLNEQGEFEDSQVTTAGGMSYTDTRVAKRAIPRSHIRDGAASIDKHARIRVDNQAKTLSTLGPNRPERLCICGDKVCHLRWGAGASRLLTFQEANADPRECCSRHVRAPEPSTVCVQGACPHESPRGPKTTGNCAARPKECGLCLEPFPARSRECDPPANDRNGSRTKCSSCLQVYHIECLARWRAEHTASSAEASCPGCRLYLSKRLPLHHRQERKLSVTLADVYMAFHNEPLIAPAPQHQVDSCMLEDQEVASRVVVQDTTPDTRQSPGKLHMQLTEAEIENGALRQTIRELQKEVSRLQTELRNCHQRSRLSTGEGANTRGFWPILAEDGLHSRGRRESANLSTFAPEPEVFTPSETPPPAANFETHGFNSFKDFVTAHFERQTGSSWISTQPPDCEDQPSIASNSESISYPSALVLNNRLLGPGDKTVIRGIPAEMSSDNKALARNLVSRRTEYAGKDHRDTGPNPPRFPTLRCEQSSPKCHADPKPDLSIFASEPRGSYGQCSGFRDVLPFRGPSAESTACVNSSGGSSVEEIDPTPKELDLPSEDFTNATASFEKLKLPSAFHSCLGFLNANSSVPAAMPFATNNHQFLETVPKLPLPTLARDSFPSPQMPQHVVHNLALQPFVQVQNMRQQKLPQEPSVLPALAVRFNCGSWERADNAPQAITITQNPDGYSGEARIPVSLDSLRSLGPASNFSVDHHSTSLLSSGMGNSGGRGIIPPPPPLLPTLRHLPDGENFKAEADIRKADDPARGDQSRPKLRKRGRRGGRKHGGQKRKPIAATGRSEGDSE